MTHPSRGRAPILAALIIVVALALAACGASGATDTPSSTAAAAAGSPSTGATFNATKFRSCLKAHGVTLPARRPGAAGPPPGAQSGSQSGSQSSARRPGFFGGGGAFANPKVRAAIQACGGGRFRGLGARRFALSHTAVLKFVACVNKHGYKLPTPNFSGKGSIFPAGIQSNPKFQKASRSCASLLRPAAGSGAGAAPPAAGTSSTSGA